MKWIMSDALEKYDGKVGIGGRNITKQRFANRCSSWGITDALVEELQELEALVKKSQQNLHKD